MYVLFPTSTSHVFSFLHTVPNLKLSRLIISTIWAWNQFFVLSLERKPSFKVIFFSGRIVQCSGNNADNLSLNQRLAEKAIQLDRGFSPYMEGRETCRILQKWQSSHGNASSYRLACRRWIAPPFRTGVLGKLPKHLDHGLRLLFGNKCCIRNT